jgi:mono/diheme cytochrome c family protein
MTESMSTLLFAFILGRGSKTSSPEVVKDVVKDVVVIKDVVKDMRFSFVGVLCLLAACAPASQTSPPPATSPNPPSAAAPATPPASTPAASPAPAASATPAAAPARAGVYTQDQAGRGRTLFAGSCSSCHAASDFSGDAFIQRWGGESAAELFNFIRATMPQDVPGSLEPQQYADIIAFFFSASGIPAGSTELKGDEDAMRGITIRR